MAAGDLRGGKGVDALLLEAIAALANLFSEPGRTANHHR
jgi:hypothetical protein